MIEEALMHYNFTNPEVVLFAIIIVGYESVGNRKLIAPASKHFLLYQ